MEQFVNLAKAMSDEGRVRIVMALADRDELCVCQITDLLGLAMPTVSRHMSVLHQAGLVGSRKEGRWVYYRLAECAAGSPAALAVAWARACLANAPRIAQDRVQLDRILTCPPEDVWRRQQAN